MQKQRIILIAGVILALVVVFLIRTYLNQQRQIAIEEVSREAAKKQENQSAVLVAKQDITKGTVIKPELLETKIFPREYVAPQAVTSLDRIGGMIAIAQIPKGEQITLSKLTYPRQAGGLAEITPVGKRAITISVDNIAALAGMIKPGDYVDVIAMIPVPVQTPEGKQITQVAVIPLFQNVLVLAVGQEKGIAFEREESRYSKEEKREFSPLITLALSPQEANIIAFVQEQGKMRLVLRSPADSQLSQIEMVTPGNLIMFLQHLFPKETPKIETKEEVEPTESTGYVEIYRGLKKERVPLSK